MAVGAVLRWCGIRDGCSGGRTSGLAKMTRWPFAALASSSLSVAQLSRTGQLDGPLIVSGASLAACRAARFMSENAPVVDLARRRRGEREGPCTTAGLEIYIFDALSFSRSLAAPLAGFATTSSSSSFQPVGLSTRGRPSPAIRCRQSP